MSEEPVPVCLLTDFGTDDPYVGIMKSIIQSSAPYPPTIDLTHEVPPQDERTAAFLLEYALPSTPTNAVVLVVVDPGVGTGRDIIAVETASGRTVVAPDTGLADGLDWDRARRVTNEDLARERISSTFHGRDWFAPVGRFLSLGGNLERLGPQKDGPASDGLIPDPDNSAEEFSGEIVHVDRFGNLITNIKSERLRKEFGETLTENSRLFIRVAERRIEGIASTYGDADSLTGIIGSYDRLEVAMPGGSARDELGIGRGEPVTVTLSKG
ncbi:MAG: S-adenosyl-l-methionine hydroxide adenosyltransferase family protein [bacterium]